MNLVNLSPPMRSLQLRREKYLLEEPIASLKILGKSYILKKWIHAKRCVEGKCYLRRKKKTWQGTHEKKEEYWEKE